MRRGDAFFPEIALRGFGRCARRDGFEHDCVGAQFARQAMDKGHWIEACGAQDCAFALECSFGTAVTLNVASASIMGSAEQRRGRRRSGLQLQPDGEQHKRMPQDRADAFDHHQCADELAMLHQWPCLPHPAQAVSCVSIGCAFAHTATAGRHRRQERRRCVTGDPYRAPRRHGA